MSKHQDTGKKKVTTLRLAEMKRQHEPIAMLTAYDYTMARLVDASGVDMILVGDSAANVMAGHSTTLPITLEQMIYHGASVVRGVECAMVIVDMPFGSYQGSPYEALNNAVRIMKETGADGLKLEGGASVAEAIRLIVQAGIPVVGHLGLTPQSVFQLGGFGLRAKEEAEAQKLLTETKLLADLGVCAIVLEKIPATLAAEARASVSVPIIGIGAGKEVDGQVLVLQDALGLDESFKPKFVRRFAHLAGQVCEALAGYVGAVKDKSFPSEAESY